jgi:hypothetical protein
MTMNAPCADTDALSLAEGVKRVEYLSADWRQIFSRNKTRPAPAVSFVY